MQKDFQDSYRSTQWQEKKNKILTRDNYTCAICGKHGDEHTLMHVHHLTYEHCKNSKAWDCPDEDLVTLCEDCHAKVHSGEPYKKALDNYQYYKNLYNILQTVKQGCIIIFYSDDDTESHVFLNLFYNKEKQRFFGIDFKEEVVHYPYYLDFDIKGLIKNGEHISLIEILPPQHTLSKLLFYISRKAKWYCEYGPKDDEGDICEDDLGTTFFWTGKSVEGCEYWYAMTHIIHLELFNNSETVAILERNLGDNTFYSDFDELSPTLKVNIALRAMSLLNLLISI